MSASSKKKKNTVEKRVKTWYYNGIVSLSIERENYGQEIRNACTSHKIETRDLYNLVLKDIQKLNQDRLIGKILVNEVKKADR